MKDSNHILLVEDEIIIAIAGKMDLEEFGYAVTLCPTGEQSVKHVYECPSIQYVLMDINLGKGIDGIEAAKQILTIRKIPIVFYSSYPESIIAEKMDPTCYAGFIPKSSGAAEIDRTIRLIDQQRMSWNI
ncbi:MAG: response regulator [Spirochaetes bacterium]|nr:response regulator [Spirochaetota bacterium]